MTLNFSRSSKRLIAFALWFCGLLFFIALSLWNLYNSKSEAENRLLNEAGRVSSQIAHLLASIGWQIDQTSIKAAISGAMTDERIYAILIETEDGIRDGQRRNYLWEPVAWDDEITEKCVQGINPLKIGGANIGKVEIWLSERMDNEEYSLLVNREILRFICITTLWTLSFILLLWYWGELHNLKNYIGNFTQNENENSDDSNPPSNEDINDDNNTESLDENMPIVSMKRGKLFRQDFPETYMIINAMFRQTFGIVPALISRLYAKGETTNIIHIGHMLELAAACIGAETLKTAAHNMCENLQDMDYSAKALSVEECVKSLEEVLTTIDIQLNHNKI